MTTNTNIKNLPMGPTNKYFTEIGYSQSYPWKEIKRTAKTRTLARVLTERDPDWKPEIIPGGFVGHCTNQGEQTWLYAGVDMNDTVTIRKVKSRYCGEDEMWANRGVKFVEDRAVEFFDYNF